MKRIPSNQAASFFGVLLILLLHATGIKAIAVQTDVQRRFLEQLRAEAENGDGGAQDVLGRTYSSDEYGVAKDWVEAVKWFRKAAEQGWVGSQFNLARCYANGEGVTKDEVEAVKWFRKAAEQNDAAAQFSLGNSYYNGEGVAKDMVEAVKWYHKAAEQNLAEAQFNLGNHYAKGEGVAKDQVEAVKWWRKAAELNYAAAQLNLGVRYAKGEGVTKDEVEAVKWFRKAAEQNYAAAQFGLGNSYYDGEGVTKDLVEAVRWYRKAAEQNCAAAQCNLGISCIYGRGVVKDEVEGYKWFLLAGSQGDAEAQRGMAVLESRLTREQVAEGQKLARAFKPREIRSSAGETSAASVEPSSPESSGSGFFISESGFLVTNEHVVKDSTQVRLVTSAGLISAKVVKVDAANDLALLKAEGRFASLPIAASRGVKLGGTVTTVGFPNPTMQGFAPKLAKGEIASLSGAGDDARYFQISVPVQPGNSGGALVDERGNVVGVVSAKLDASIAFKTSGALPENVNYAVKSSYLLSFLESVPEVSAKLKEAQTKDQKFEDVVKEAEQAAVLVLVY